MSETPDNSKVICPNCCHQFGAISVDDQKRVKELEGECGIDQRNAAMSQKESMDLLHKLDHANKRIAELEATLAAKEKVQSANEDEFEETVLGLEKRVRELEGERHGEKAGFLWPHAEDSVEEAGYELINGKTEEYKKTWWGILLARVSESNGHAEKIAELGKRVRELEATIDDFLNSEMESTKGLEQVMEKKGGV
jgi:uncharacterized Zn finger protein (UPF0148 family)